MMLGEILLIVVPHLISLIGGSLVTISAVWSSEPGAAAFPATNTCTDDGSENHKDPNDDVAITDLAAAGGGAPTCP